MNSYIYIKIGGGQCKETSKLLNTLINIYYIWIILIHIFFVKTYYTKILTFFVKNYYAKMFKFIVKILLYKKDLTLILFKYNQPVLMLSTIVMMWMNSIKET